MCTNISHYLYEHHFNRQNKLYLNPFYNVSLLFCCDFVSGMYVDQIWYVPWVIVLSETGIASECVPGSFDMVIPSGTNER